MKTLKDIRFWILLFFLIRLFNITQAPLETAHNWRQVTGNMVARNFYEIDANILYPRLDFAGNSEGIAGTEFPLMNYFHFVLSKAFGFQHWYGRLINLIMASIGLFYFFKIIRRFFSQEHAFYATMVLLFSLWFSYSRKSMPDLFSFSLCIMSLYYGLRFLYDNSNVKNGLLYFLLGCLGVLSKIPSAYIFIILLIPFLDKKILIRPKIILGLLSVLLLVPSIWWYFYWVPYLTKTYGFDHYFMGDPIGVGAKELLLHFGETSKKFYADALGYIGFGLFFCALVYSMIKKEKKVLIVFTLTSVLFLLFMFKSGYNFAHHSYYVLPYIPVMAFVLGWALTELRKPSVTYILLALIAIENVANQQHDFFTKESEKHKLELETILDQYSDRTDLIAISGSPNPQEMYFAHRKGWIFNENEVNNPGFIKKIQAGGCKLIVVNKHHFDRSFNNFKTIYEDKNYRLFRIE